MLPKRIAILAVTAGLGLLSGCSSLSECSWFNRFRSAGCPECDGFEGDAGPVVDGPAVEEAGPAVEPSVPMAPPPREVMPPFEAPPPRLVPQPQAQPSPYTPTQRKGFVWR
jgi:hypothetical protein